MLKLRAYIRYRKLGLSRFKAIDLANCMDCTRLDKIIILACTVSILTIIAAYFYKHEPFNNVYSKAIANISLVNKYESVIIGCLNSGGIILNGRNMECKIAEYKGQ